VHGDGEVEPVTFRPSPEGLAEERCLRGLHPLTAQRLNLWRLKNFHGERLPSAEDTYLFHVVAKEQPERRALHRDGRGPRPDAAARRERRGHRLPDRRAAARRLPDGLRRAQAQRGASRRLEHNRIFLYAWPSIELPLAELASFAKTSAPLTTGAGLDEIVLLARLQEEPDVEPREVALRFAHQPGAGVRVTVTDRPTEPMRPLDDYTQKVLRSRARGAVYPYELAPLLAGPGGAFVEHDLDATGGSCRSSASPAATGRASSPAWSARRRRATPRA
jgi:hypothetical protein